MVKYCTREKLFYSLLTFACSLDIEKIGFTLLIGLKPPGVDFLVFFPLSCLNSLFRLRITTVIARLLSCKSACKRTILEVHLDILAAVHKSQTLLQNDKLSLV